jgi:hypothetical protein
MNREEMIKELRVLEMYNYSPALKRAINLLANPLPRGRLVALYNLDLHTFAKVFYGRDEVDYYIKEKFDKFRENPHGSILDLDSTGYERVVEFLTSTE